MLYRRAAIVSSAFLMATALLSSPAFAATRVTVPDGTPIPFHLVSGVNTEENHVGDIVPISTVGDVVVDGWVVIPDASKGECQVAKVEPSGGHGHPGKIELTCTYVVSADHGRLRLQNAVISQEGEKKHGIATVAGIFTYGIASNAVHGNEASINTTRTMSAKVDGTVHVEAIAKSRSDSGVYNK